MGTKAVLSTVRAPIVLLVLLAAGTAGATDWRTYAGGPRRLFFNPAETTITSANVGQLEIKWTFPTGAIVTASPSIVSLDIPGEGRMPIAFIQSWDGNLYALRVRNGTELWRFEADQQAGKSYPNASSFDVQELDGIERVYFSAGETVYCIDAITGGELWRFDAGTGCVDPPGLCAFDGERNEVESSPILAEDRIFFGMEVNDREVGKGGLYAIDARYGHLVWFFDLETGMTCHPLPGDDIRRFDGYHTEAELGLPAGFLGSRPGCDFDRTITGCANIWSSASLDVARRMLFTASSNCDTDDDPGTLRPPPPMPPYDEAIFAVDFDGNPVWRWRPREVDNGDLAFGAVPNLFTIDVDVGGSPVARDVVGVGNKDGTYYVIDREGTNVANGVQWDGPNSSSLPYWSTQAVPGGAIGGIISTAAVDEARGRIYFSTAPGINPLIPQRPTVHALDANTGAIIWENTTEYNADASYAPTSAIPGVVFTGSVVGGFLRAYDSETGARLRRIAIGFSASSAPAVVDGIAIVGAGVGERGDPDDIQDIVSRFPADVTALCVPGTPACQRLSPVACYKARATPGSGGFDPIPSVTLADRLGSRTASVERPLSICNPADKNGEDAAIPWDPDHLKGYLIKRPSGEPRFKRVRDIEVVNDFGTTVVDAVKPDRLLVPSAMSLSENPPALPAAVRIDHFQCYRARRARGTAKFEKVRGVTVVDEFGTMTVDVKRPRRLCVPVDKNGEAPDAPTHTDNLMCYRVKVTRGTPKFTALSPVFGNNEFGSDSLAALRPEMLCVPSLISSPNLPTTTTTSTTSTTTVVVSSTTTTTLLYTWAQVHAALDANCAFLCHSNPPGDEGLWGLHDFDQAYDNLVNVPSNQVPEMVLVKPFDSLASYLMHKIDGTHEVVGGSGAPMPLPAGDANGIRAWINAGAVK
jgi:outer membrane protein assembly factor BamB